MYQNFTVNLGNLLLSFSDAMDLVNSYLYQHQQRTAFISWKIAKAAGLPDDILENLFIAALLHDVGALTPEEKISLHNFEVENTLIHCIKGERLLKQIDFLIIPSKIVSSHHTKWNEWDISIDNPIVFSSQILFLSDLIERMIDREKYILHQDKTLISKIVSLSGTFIHPKIVGYFKEICNNEDFWLDLVSSRLYSILLNEGPYRRLEIDIANILKISELFRNIIDFKSHYTATHSTGVAASAYAISRIFGLSEIELQFMEIAGNLHDLGKLIIPNKILDKPEKLTEDEFAIMRQHTYYTYSILKTIGGLNTITEWAAFHHEKLDGSGYPFHLNAEKLNVGARIMAVADIFTALVEDRPYRKGLPKKSVNTILDKFANEKLLDKRVIDILMNNYDGILYYKNEQQAKAWNFYKKQFCDFNNH